MNDRHGSETVGIMGLDSEGLYLNWNGKNLVEKLEGDGCFWGG